MTQKLKPIEILVWWHMIHVIKSRWSIYRVDIFFRHVLYYISRQVSNHHSHPHIQYSIQKTSLTKMYEWKRRELQVRGLTLPVFWDVGNYGWCKFLGLLVPFFCLVWRLLSHASVLLSCLLPSPQRISADGSKSYFLGDSLQ